MKQVLRIASQFSGSHAQEWQKVAKVWRLVSATLATEGWPG